MTLHFRNHWVVIIRNRQNITEQRRRCCQSSSWSSSSFASASLLLLLLFSFSSSPRLLLVFSSCSFLLFSSLLFYSSYSFLRLFFSSSASSSLRFFSSSASVSVSSSAHGSAITSSGRTLYPLPSPLQFIPPSCLEPSSKPTPFEYAFTNQCLCSASQICTRNKLMYSFSDCRALHRRRAEALIAAVPPFYTKGVTWTCNRKVLSICQSVICLVSGTVSRFWWNFIILCGQVTRFRSFWRTCCLHFRVYGSKRPLVNVCTSLQEYAISQKAAILIITNFK